MGEGGGVGEKVEELRVACQMMAGALKTLTDVASGKLEDLMQAVREVKGNASDVKARLEEVDASLHRVVGGLEDVRSRLARLEELERRVRGVEEAVSRLTRGLESLLAFLYIEYLRDVAGENVVGFSRRSLVGGREVGLVIETEGALYVVEVKISPTHDDVGRLVAAREILEREAGKPVKAVLVGVGVGEEVAEYAKSRGVEVVLL